MSNAINRSLLNTYFKRNIPSANNIVNPSAEQDLTGWTAVNVTATRDATSGYQINGVASFKLASASGAATFKSNAITLGDELAGQSCQASMVYKGDGSLWTLSLLDGSNVVLTSVALNNVTNFQKAELYYPCTSGYKLQVSSTSGADIRVGQFSWGLATTYQVSQAQLVGGIVITGCSGNAFGFSTTSFASPNTVPTGCVYTPFGSATAPGSTVAGLTFASLPPGEYKIEYEGGVYNFSTNKTFYVQATDGTTTARETSSFYSNSGAVQTPGMSQSFSYTTVKSNVTWQLYGKAESGGGAYILGTDTYPGVIRLYRFPSQSEIAVSARMPSVPTIQKFLSGSGTYTTPIGVKYIEVKMVGGGGGGGSAYTGSTDGGSGGPTTFGTSLLTATGGAGGIRGGGGVNTAGGTGTINAPATGFSVTGAAGNGGVATATQNSGGMGAATAFGGGGGGVTGDGSNSGAGFPAPPNSGAGGGGGGGSTGGGQGGCAGGYIEAHISSPAASYSYAVGAPGTSGGTNPGGSGGSGGIIVTEHYYSENAPLLVGSVTSNSAGMERVERARIGFSGGTPSVTRQSGSWISSLTDNGGGRTQLNIASGIFSTTPDCVCTTEDQNIIAGMLNTSSVRVDCNTNNTGGTGTDANFQIICMGPR